MTNHKFSLRLNAQDLQESIREAVKRVLALKGLEYSGWCSTEEFKFKTLKDGLLQIDVSVEVYGDPLSKAEKIMRFAE